MPRTYYERDEDWLVTCPECQGKGTIGTGVSRTKCTKCNGAGRIKRQNAMNVYKQSFCLLDQTDDSMPKCPNCAAHMKEPDKEWNFG